MTTPSIRETLLTFHARANLATEHLRREAEQLREEAPCLGPAFAGTRRLVTARLGNIEHEADMLERDLVQDVAALLCLRTDDTGGCDIDLPPRRPAGRPTKLEAAARVKVVADPPPADSAPKEEATTPQEQPDAEGPSGLAAAFEAIDRDAAAAIVQWCRENGETDHRSMLHSIRGLTPENQNAKDEE